MCSYSLQSISILDNGIDIYPNILLYVAKSMSDITAYEMVYLLEVKYINTNTTDYYNYFPEFQEDDKKETDSVLVEEHHPEG